MRRIFAAALVLLVLSATATSARAPSGGPPLEHRFMLPNGLRVIVQPDHALPVAAIALAVHAGSAQDAPGTRGMAHLFEHLMFLGSRHLGPGGIDALSARVGGSGATGSTFPDTTVYRQAFPAEVIELMIWAEAEKLGFFIDDLTARQLDAERRVVLDEFASTMETAPFGGEDAALSQMLFPDGPYRFANMGRRVDIEGVTLEDARRFYGRGYTPRNSVLVVTGDVDAVMVEAWVRRYFGAILPGPPLPRLAPAPAPVAPGRRIVLEDRAATGTVLTLAWAAAGLNDADVASLLLAERVISAVAAAGGTGTSDVTVQYEAREAGGLFRLRAENAAPVGLDPAERKLSGLLRAAPDAVSYERLAAAKAQLKRDVLGAADGVENRAAMTARFAAMTADDRFLTRLVAAIDGVSARQVRDQLRSLTGRTPAVLSIVPVGRSELAAARSLSFVPVADARKDASPPQLSGPTADRFPNPPAVAPAGRPAAVARWHAVRPDGVVVDGATVPALALQYAELRADMPIGFDPERNAVLRLLFEAARVRATPARLPPGAALANTTQVWTRDAATIRVKLAGLPSDWSGAIDQTSAAIRQSRWDTRAFEAARAQALAALRRERTDARTKARATLLARLFEGHEPVEPAAVEAALAALSPTRASAVQRALFFDARIAVRTRGPLAPTAPTRTVSRPSPTKRIDLCRPAAQRSRTAPLFLTVTGAPRVEIAAGSAAAPHNSPQRTAEDVLAYMLGGTFSSPLVRELRERRGLTTSVRARISDDSGCPMLLIGMSVAQDKAVETAAVLGTVVSDFRDRITAEQVATSWRSLTRARLVEASDPGADAAVGSEVIAATAPTHADVVRAYDRLLGNGRLTMVMAGSVTEDATK